MMNYDACSVYNVYWTDDSALCALFEKEQPPNNNNNNNNKKPTFCSKRIKIIF